MQRALKTVLACLNTSAIGTSGVRLNQLAQGRENNLNLIRAMAAIAVLFSHSYVISTGNLKSEPWDATVGMSPGGVAVFVFFTLSGFLVTGSLLRSQSLTEFSAARALRIYPALLIALVAYTAIIGFEFSGLTATDFFHDPQTWRYVLRNAVMITGGDAVLPGAFPENPIKSQVNFSLWTLRWELRLYFLLGLMWWSTRQLISEKDRLWVMRVMIVLTTITLLAATFTCSYLDRPANALRVCAMFFCGASYWLYADRIRISGIPTFAILACLAVSATIGPLAFEMVFRIGLPYLLMYFGFVIPPLRSYNRVGDYSYGIYIYACPVQQMVVAMAPGISTWGLSAIALPVVTVLAQISWHWVEKPASRLKHRRRAIFRNK